MLKQKKYTSLRNLEFYTKTGDNSFKDQFIAFLISKGIKKDGHVYIILTEYFGYTLDHFKFLLNEQWFIDLHKKADPSKELIERFLLDEVLTAHEEEMVKLENYLTLTIDIVLHSQITAKWDVSVAVHELSLIAAYCFKDTRLINELLDEFAITVVVNGGIQNTNAIILNKRELFQKILSKRDLLLEMGNNHLVNQTVEKLRELEEFCENNKGI